MLQLACKPVPNSERKVDDEYGKKSSLQITEASPSRDWARPRMHGMVGKSLFIGIVEDVFWTGNESRGAWDKA